MRLGNQGTAFLPEGGPLPGGSYPVSLRIELNEDGLASGEVHFLSEPKYPRPVSIGTEFDLHVPNPGSLLGDNVILRVRFVDDSGSVVGYAYGSPAQFRPRPKENLPKTEDVPVNPKNIFVIHGRDERLRAGMFDFLRSLGLNPMEWTRAVKLTGKGAPYVGEVLDAAFANAQAVVVLLTPDDVAMLRPELHGAKEPTHETELTPQARPNVLFESGMAMARQPNRTILVEIGDLRPFSDIGGRHTVRMDNSSKKRNELATRLENAGCPVDLSGTDWQTAGDLSAPELRGDPETTSRSVAQSATSNSVQASAHLLPDLISELEDNLEAARAPRAGDVYVRPSNRVWSENRSKLPLPEAIRTRVVNVYRQINRWLDIVLSGLHPNMGSPTLEAMVGSLRHELPEVIAELKKLEK